MKIHIYSIMRDEVDILPYFLRHYSTFADRIFIIDDHSTDKTIEIAKANSKVTILDYKFTEGYIEKEHNACFEGFYKKYSRGVADWVMVVDADEFVYSENLIPTLETQQKLGTKIIKTSGFNMFSQNYPTTNGQIYEACKTGLRAYRYDKAIIFNPDTEVSFTGGRHKTYIDGKLRRYPKAYIFLLHYRYLSLISALKPFIKIKVYQDGKLMRNIREALSRYENAIEAIKKGENLKVI